MIANRQLNPIRSRLAPDRLEDVDLDLCYTNEGHDGDFLAGKDLYEEFEYDDVENNYGGEEDDVPVLLETVDSDDEDSSSSDEDEQYDEIASDDEDDQDQDQDNGDIIDLTAESDDEESSVHEDESSDDEQDENNEIDMEALFKELGVGTTRSDWDFSKRTSRNWNRFNIEVPSPPKNVVSPMSPFSEKDHRAVRHADEIAFKMLAEIDKYLGLLVNPKGTYAHSFLITNEEAGTNSTIYTEHGTDRTRPRPRKVGSAGNPKYRFANGYVSGTLFLLLLNLDYLPKELDKSLIKLFKIFCRRVINDKNVPKAIRELFRTVILRHGHSFCKKPIIRLLVEIGCQNRFNLPRGAVKEFLMYEDAKLKQWRLYVNIACAVLFRVMEIYFGITDATADQIALLLDMLSSWTTYYSAVQGKLSSQKVVTQAVNGPEPLDWFETDTLPWPARPNAKNNDEAFSTDYSDKQKRYGRRKVRFTVRRAGKYTVLILDQNQNPLFPNWGLDRMLVLEYGFIPMVKVHQGEIRLYLHPTRMVAALVHRPYCIGGDSRIVVKLEHTILRNITNQIMIKTGQWIRGGYRKQTFPNEKADALIACFFLLAVHIGFHLHKIHAVAFYKDRITPEDIYACEYNDIPKILDIDFPIARNNRRAVRGTVTKAESNRKAIKNIIVRGMNLCMSFQLAPARDNVVSLVVSLEDLLASKNSKRFSKRWAHLWKRLQVCPELLDLVKACRKSRMTRKGNSDACGATKETKRSNNQILDDILFEHNNDPAYRFWLHKLARTIKAPDYDEDDLNNHTIFPICEPTLRGHFDHSRKAGKVIKTEKKKYAPPHLSLVKVSPIRNRPAISNGCLILCKIVVNPSKKVVPDKGGDTDETDDTVGTDAS